VNFFMKLALGRSGYSTVFLLIFMVVAPSAVFTSYTWLDHVAWATLIILGLFIFITGMVTFNEAVASHRWPSAPAKLKSASLRWRTSNGSRRYSPSITCTFTVKGIEYSGTEFDFSAAYTSKEKAKEKVSQVKSKSELWLYYKPGDPSVNVIHPGVHLVQYIRLIIGLAVMVISALSWMGVIQYS